MLPGTIQIEVKGLRELTDRLNQLPDKLSARLFVKGISAGAKVIQQAVAARAPVRQVPQGRRPGMPIKKGSGTMRYPGTLKTHIIRKRYKRPGTQKVTYDIMPTGLAWYGRLVETGTRHAAAKPFMRPAVDAEGEAAINRVADVIRQGLDAAVKAST